MNMVSQEVAATSDPYTQLVGAVVLPRLSAAITNDWEPRNPEPMLQFMDAWEPHLPRPALQHILHSLILPKVCPRCVWNWKHSPDLLEAWLRWCLELKATPSSSPWFVPAHTALQAAEALPK